MLIADYIPDPFDQNEKQSNSNEYRSNEENNTKEDANKEGNYHGLFNHYHLLIVCNVQA